MLAVVRAFMQRWKQRETLSSKLTMLQLIAMWPPQATFISKRKTFRQTNSITVSVISSCWINSGVFFACVCVRMLEVLLLFSSLLIFFVRQNSFQLVSLPAMSWLPLLQAQAALLARHVNKHVLPRHMKGNSGGTAMGIPLLFLAMDGRTGWLLNTARLGPWFLLSMCVHDFKGGTNCSQWVHEYGIKSSNQSHVWMYVCDFKGLVLAFIGDDLSVF